jgi:hypothetical protein
MEQEAIVFCEEDF